MKKFTVTIFILLVTLMCYSQSVTISGLTGNCAALDNLTHTFCGTHNGKNKYCATAFDLDFEIRWTGTAWEWYDVTSAADNGNNTATTTLPPCTGWTGGTFQCNDTNPFSLTGDCETPPPASVELYSFDVIVKTRSAVLEWRTASETNNEGFMIEHSPDNHNWETIGFVIGGGTTFEQNVYSFQHDETIIGVNYYRLKQIDYDGVFEYSDVVNVEFESGNQRFTISPNPTSTGQFILSFSDSNFESGELEIYDSVGRLIQSQNISKNNTEIQTADLPKGIYLVNLEVNGQRFIERVVIQ